MGKPILIAHNRAPGDITCLTAAVRDLALTYPGKFDIHVLTTCSQIWKHNPHVVKICNEPLPHIERIDATYGPQITDTNEHVAQRHFVSAFHKDLGKQLGVKLHCLFPKGDLYLDDWHKANPPISGRYWYMIAGGKQDATVKIWSANNWQIVVDRLNALGLRIVQDGTNIAGHIHPRLDGVLNVIGTGDLRDMIWKIYHAEGVLCTVTAAMHMAAALDKPCVVVAGGREHWHWEAYVNVVGGLFGPKCAPVAVPHQYLHTIGLLPCCKVKGCWMNKVTKKEPDKDGRWCKRPIDDGYGQMIPTCLSVITPEHVEKAVLSYYANGTLPPLKNLAAPLPVMLRQPEAATTPPVIPTRPTTITPDAIYDDPIIGGQVTIGVLLYGNYPDMHRRCLNSILSTVPRSRRDLRVGCNAVCDASLTYVKRLQDEGHINVTYINENIKKYPAMRQMFWDPAHPITNKWIIWFDDDTIADRDPQWCSRLLQTIVMCYPQKYRMFGDIRVWTFDFYQAAWVKSRPWYRDRQFQLANGSPAANGNRVVFAAGGFWALETAVMREADIPDVQLGHNGGDYMIGEQVWQAGYSTRWWNKNKAHVHTSSVSRRGLDEVHTGKAGWKPGGTAK